MIQRMKLINTDKAEGTKVAGKYLGLFPFIGIVSKVRFAPRSSYLYEVTLDAPITVFGMVQNFVQFYSGDEDAQTVEVVA